MMIHKILLSRDIYLEVERGWNHFLLNDNKHFRKGDMLAIYCDDNNPYNNVKRCFGTICKMSIPYGSSRRVFIEKPKEEIIFPFNLSGHEPEEITIIVKTKDDCVLVRKIDDICYLPVKQVEDEKTIKKSVEEILSELIIDSFNIGDSYMLCNYKKKEFTSIENCTYGCVWLVEVSGIPPSKNAELLDIRKEKETISDNQIPFIEMLLCEEKLNRLRANSNYEYFIDIFMKQSLQSKFVVRLRNYGIIRNGGEYPPKIFNSYFSARDYINKPEDYILCTNDAIWEICRFQNQKLVARLCLTMQNNPIFWETYI